MKRLGVDICFGCRFNFTKHRPTSCVATVRRVNPAFFIHKLSRVRVVDGVKQIHSHNPYFPETSEVLPYQGLSYHVGPTSPPLKHATFGGLLREQVSLNGDGECLISAWQGIRWTYRELDKRSEELAKSLFALGVRKGDRMAIMAGNCGEYILTFFAAAKIGAILAVLNPAYKDEEVEFALRSIQTKIFITTPGLNGRSHIPLLKHLAPSLMLSSPSPVLPSLEHIILINNCGTIPKDLSNFLPFNDLDRITLDLSTIEKTLSPYDVVNLQFTSGTTGSSKAAMLTHHNIVNNARFLGDNMALTSKDKICIPPPLFHCFGLVLGTLAAFTHGATAVYASETFNPGEVLRVLSQEKCTVLHGVPTMFVQELDDKDFWKYDYSSLRWPVDRRRLRGRTGIVAGSSIPAKLMERIHKKLNLTGLTICYGMTETSPVSYQTTLHCPLKKRIETVGRILPHTRAKIVNPKTHEILPIGHRGELYVSGYLLQKGYWEDEEKTKESMVRDREGRLWMRTGDEGSMDTEGYLSITGGENIIPLEIENVLFSHPAILQASVVAIADEKYGEVVGAFVERNPHVQNVPHLARDKLKNFVSERLSKFKVPRYVFFLGEDGIAQRWPVTASGKIRKVELRAWGNEAVKSGRVIE